MRTNFSLAPAVLALTLCAGVGAARADETIVSETVISGLPSSVQAQTPGTDKPVITTLYYKGGQWRSEANGAVLLAGGADGKIYTLNPAAKTYSVASGSLANAQALNNPMLAMMKFKTKAFVHPAGETKTIAGKAAKSYKFDAVVHMSMGDGDDPATDSMLPTVKITGEEWASEALSLPASPFAMGAGGLGKLMPGPLSNGFGDLTTQLAAIKGYPLVNTISIDVVFPEGSPLAAMAGDSVPTKITVTQTAKSVSDAPLADDLFHVPTDYKRVDAPAAPGLPIPGGAPAADPVVAPPATPPAAL